ncbi:MAG: hypothetical protein ACP5T0_10055 [Verrucomicrobiia bacterium]
MKINVSKYLKSCNSSALLIVMVMGAAAMIVLAGTLKWTSTNGILLNRNIAYQNSVIAAEAATEKVVSEIATDYAKEGPTVVGNKLNNYRARIPNEHIFWGKYKFKNRNGNKDKISVDFVQPWTADTPLLSQYSGLKGYAATIRIRANAEDVVDKTEGAVYQDIQLALLPVFQFAIFYNLDLEVNPGPIMNITGRVHSNRDIFCQPQNVLNFWSPVTAAGKIFPGQKKPGDPSSRPAGKLNFLDRYESDFSTLNLPIGTNGSPDSVREIVEIPENSENPNDPMAKQRFYNNCDIVIVVSNNAVSVRGSGICNGLGINIQWSVASNWLSTNKTFYDQRENKTNIVTEIDIAKFSQWATNNANNPLRNVVRNTQGREINSIYVADRRKGSSTILPVVRLVNGDKLPPSGFTLATPNPLYIKGNYNAYGSSLGSTNTANTKPASLIADAITILSGNWDDSKSKLGISSRVAESTTVNAAFFAGIVETVPGHYSGGLENFPRFLENWSGKIFTYNGSMVVMFPSKYATNYWPSTGAVYNAPNRNWSFDVNFYNPERLPPLTPSVRAIIRYKWKNVAPSDNS